MRRGLGGVALAALLATAPWSWPQTAVADARPANLRPDPKTDEGGLWLSVDRAEREAQASAELNADPVLNREVKRIACKLAPEYCGELRIYVMDRPFFNASMAPNGYMEVWSGLLLRAESESQLAFVLGHEIGHFAESHSLERWRVQKSRGSTAMILSMAVGAVAMGAAASAPASSPAAAQSQMNDAMRAAGSVSDLIYLAAVASVFSFSRQNETEADRLGYERAVRAGYDPVAPATLWRDQVAETAASDFPKVRAQNARGSLFASHPIDSDRIAALEALAASAPKGPPDGVKAYRAMIRPFLGAWLKDDLRRRDFGQTLNLIARMSREGEDLGVLTFYRGEALRLRRGAGDLDQARAAYVAATAYRDAPAAAWRNLGDLAGQAGDKPAARAAYQAYLAQAPDAQDRWLVEANLKKLDGESGV